MLREIRSGVLALAYLNSPKRTDKDGKIKYMESIKTQKGVQLFCMKGNVHDLITRSNFGQDWSRGFGTVRGQILAFPLICVIVNATFSHCHVKV